MGHKHTKISRKPKPEPELAVRPLAPFQEFQQVTAPLDDEGFVQSFAVVDDAGEISEEQLQAAKLFFDEYGFVVLDRVLTPEQCAVSVAELWEMLRVMVTTSLSWLELDPTKPETIANAAKVISRTGIVGNEVFGTPSGWRNRAAPTLEAAFSRMIGCDDLLVSLDRACVMVPTKQVPTVVEAPDGSTSTIEIRDRPDLKTSDAWFHWDLNPWAWTQVEKLPPPMTLSTDSWATPREANTEFITEHNGSDPIGFPKVQGLVALVDSRADDGGFITVPGFHKFLAQWAAQTEIYSSFSFVPVRPEMTWCEYAQKITMRAGSLVIWNSCMPHCNFSNDSSNLRMCQYIKMFPRQMCQQPLERARAIVKLLPPEFELDQHAIKVFGLDVLPADELQQGRGEWANWRD